VSDQKYFPGIIGSIVILFCLWVLEVLIVWLFYDFGIKVSLGDPKLSIVTVIACGIFLSMYVNITKVTYKDILNPSVNSAKSITVFSFVPVLLTITGAYFWLGNVEAYIASLFPVDSVSLQMLDELMAGGIFTFFAVCIVAPITEEIVFRGIILRGLLLQHSPFSAIIASSVLFGAVHCNIYQVPGAFIFGCFVGWLFYISRSIWPPIMAHAFFNFMVFLCDDGESDYVQADPEYYGVDVFLLSLIISVIGIYWCCRVFCRKK
jgi:uncharacterized protein